MLRRRARSFAVAATTLGAVGGLVVGVLANYLTLDNADALAGLLAAVVALIAFGLTLGSARVATEDARELARAADESAALSRVTVAVRAQVEMRSTRFPLEISLRSRERAGTTITDEQFLDTFASSADSILMIGAPGAGKTTLAWRLAAKILENRGSDESATIPLLVQCSQWSRTADGEFDDWITTAIKNYYGIQPTVTLRWLRQSRVLLMFDGFDEIADLDRERFIKNLRERQNSPVPGRYLLTSRTDVLSEHDITDWDGVVAEVLPLSNDVFANTMRGLVETSGAKPFDADDLTRLYNLFRSSKRTFNHTPILLDLIERAYSASHTAKPANSTNIEPAELAVKLGDDARDHGDTTNALNSYLAAASSDQSSWRARGGLWASLLLAKEGNDRLASDVLETCMRNELSDWMARSAAPPADQLTDDESAVLETLTDRRDLTALEISSATRITPSRSNRAIRTLRSRGLIEKLESDSADPRFRRSSVDLVG